MPSAVEAASAAQDISVVVVTSAAAVAAAVTSVAVAAVTSAVAAVTAVAVDTAKSNQRMAGSLPAILISSHPLLCGSSPKSSVFAICFSGAQ